MARDPAPSILAALKARGQSAPRVRLNEVPDESSPTLAEVELRPGARFEVLGQIAQGGVGRVVKGRDVDLGRDVALKVLLEKHLDNTDLVRRFVEEAQIGGQLQHPGIVPVYELGLLPDRQPFFAMKLVKGKTLAALLAERDSPESDRRRLLSVFERVCRTMAYAHSRGVIHRDLKPSNVMVGAFGEVQILDWGFAKVLEQGGIADEKRRKLEQADITRIATLRSEGVGSESIPGSVMGTPAYMPPEQALGHIDEMDERSDVFSLGAILTELLTGDPPYAGAESPMDCILMAIRGDVEAALERLEACEADPALTDLATRCLSALRKDRPRDAGEMAEAVSAYLTEIDARAHRSRVAAEEARTKAEEEHAKAERARAKAEAARAEAAQLRRKRRQTMVLAASIVLVLLIGGGAWAWIAGDRHTQEQEAARAVSEALKEAAHARGEGDLTKALALATKARDLAVAREADEATRARTEGVLRELESEACTAAERQALEKADAELLERLETIEPELSELPDWAGLDKDYLSLFNEYGLDLSAEEPAEAAAWVCSRTCPEELAAHLDDWAFRRRLHLEELDWRRLEEIARLADPEPFRDAIRRALIEDRSKDLRRIAAEADPEELSPANIAWLSKVLVVVGEDRQRTRSLVREGVRLHPGNYELRFALANSLILVGDRLSAREELQESVEHCTAAIALRPDSAWAWSMRGVALRQLGDLEGAVADAWRAAELAPELHPIHNNLGNVLQQRGDCEDAVAAFEKALELGPGSASLYIGLANSLRSMKEIDRAIEVYGEGLETHPEHPLLLYNLGAIYSDERGEHEKALEIFRRVTELAPDWPPGHYSVGNALHATGRPRDAVVAYRTALELVRDKHLVAWSRNARPPGGTTNLRAAIQHNLGSALWSLEKLDEAIASHRAAIDVDPNHHASHVHLAQLLQRTGEPDEALELLRKTVEAEPDYRGGHIALGSSLVRVGRLREGAATLEEAARRFPRQPVAWGNLGNVRYQLGDWPGAEAALRKALDINPDWPIVLLWFSEVLIHLNKTPEAIEVATRAADLSPAMKMAQAMLGWAYLVDGRLAKARDAYTEALDARMPHVRAGAEEMVAKCTRFLATEERLPAILNGRDVPKGAQEFFDAAQVLQLLDKNHVTRLRLYRRAFELDPSVDEGDRYDAACTSIQCGDRGQAMIWLRESLSFRQTQVKAADNEHALGRVVGSLRWYRLDADLAPVREEAELAKLPETEREEWRTFWQEVDALIREAEK